MTVEDKLATAAEADPRANNAVLANNAALTCVSAASFQFPERTSVGSGWAEHGPFAMWLIDALRPKVLVELGTYKGYSFAAFCQAIRETRTQCRCYAVDTWQGDEHAGFYGDRIYDELTAYIDVRYSAFARLVRSTFDEALAHFDDGCVELLHIDGRHHYEDASHDYQSWIPKLAPNAVVLFHDINVRERSFGVYRLWEELKAKHEHFEFLHGNGLGVLGLGSQLPEAVQRLLKLSRNPDAAAVVQQVYSRLGKAVSDHCEVADHGADVANSLKGGIEERDGEIIRLRAEKAALQEDNAKLMSGILVSRNLADITKDSDSTVIIARLNEDIESQSATIRGLQQSLKEAHLRFRK